MTTFRPRRRGLSDRPSDARRTPASCPVAADMNYLLPTAPEVPALEYGHI